MATSPLGRPLPEKRRQEADGKTGSAHIGGPDLDQVKLALGHNMPANLSSSQV